VNSSLQNLPVAQSPIDTNLIKLFVRAQTLSLILLLKLISMISVYLHLNGWRFLKRTPKRTPNCGFGVVFETRGVVLITL